jgi:hypothetical protein
VALARAGLIGAALLLSGLAACSATSGTARIASSTVTRAVVRAQRPDLLVLSRDRGDCHLLLNSGAWVTAPAVAVNGTSASALCVDAYARLTAGAISVQGGLLRHGGALSAAPQLEQPASANWLATLRPPAAPAASCPGAACPDGTNLVAAGTYRLLPGTYQVTINVSSRAMVCVAPGSYVLRASWNLDAPLHPYGSAGCPAVPSGSSRGVLLYFARGHVQCNSGGELTLLRAMQRGPYRGLLYWQASRRATAIDGAGFAGGGWYEPAGALILNSGASLSAPFVAAATITVDARARLAVSGPRPDRTLGQRPRGAAASRPAREQAATEERALQGPVAVHAAAAEAGHLARGVQAGNWLPGLVKHLSVEVGVQAAERLAREDV